MWYLRSEIIRQFWNASSHGAGYTLFIDGDATRIITFAMLHHLVPFLDTNIFFYVGGNFLLGGLLEESWPASVYLVLRLICRSSRVPILALSLLRTVTSIIPGSLMTDVYSSLWWKFELGARTSYRPSSFFLKSFLGGVFWRA